MISNSPRLGLWLTILLLAAVTSVAAQQPPGKPASAQEAAAAGASATSFDEDGTPTFLWAADGRGAPAGSNANGAARYHLGRFARAYKTAAADLAAAEVLSVQQVGGNVIAHMKQRVSGVDVYGSDVKVLMRGDHRLVAISGRPRALRGSQPAFDLSAEAALARALSDFFSADVPVSGVSAAPDAAPGSAARFQVQAGNLHMPEPAAVTRTLFPQGGDLVAAYIVSFYAGTTESGDSAAYRYIVAASDGRVLDKRDLTVYEAPPGGNGDPRPEFHYRVFADADGRPIDNPQQENSPHPTGVPDGIQPPFILPNLFTTHGLNHQPTPNADPWLPATATETNGNNADAYVDHRAPDGLSAGDFRADLTSARTFDRTYDTSASPVATTDQSKAAIASAFYIVNWLHDYWYDAGFTETARNAQRDNYGRGGVEGDAMRVEVQDNYFGGARNNANMATPTDGIAPRMQIFAWTGLDTVQLTLTPGGSRQAGTASFGPQGFDLTAPVALASDAVAPFTNACEPLAPAAGQIVLVDRGVCTFVIKALNVQAAGGVGMIVANNAPGAAPGLGGIDPTVTIPAMSLSQADGAALKTALLAGSVSAHLLRVPGIEREGALDTTLVAHEWGHYLHHRLTDCGTTQCRAMSEGWGDFVSLHTMARDGDNLDGTYAAVAYATSGLDPNSQYWGIRRFPYSVDFTKNALTFKHISDGIALPPTPGTPFGPNSEVHNAGEIWASMLWEGYVGLQKARRPGRTFDDVRRRMADYIVTGLQLAPPNATYLETRDAILAAAEASPPGHHATDNDLLELAEAFARRGAGSCAIGPDRLSVTFTGITESFDVKPRIELGTPRLVEDQHSCDGDGILDAGERGQVTLTVMNAGPVALGDTTVTITSTTAGITFTKGNVVHIKRLAPFASVEISVDVALASSFTGLGQAMFEAHVSNGSACETDVQRTFAAWINADEAIGVSRTDTVETSSTAWTPTGANAGDVWSRVEASLLDKAWLGIDFGAISDTQLMSPALQVSATQPLVITFDHRYGFELSDQNYDGGVIEVSRDGGATWLDISVFVAPGYGGTIFTDSGNPLGGRPGFVGRNAAFPAREPLSLNLGTEFAGETIRVRFRIGTDANTGDFGWELDNLAFSGITNTPFASLVADTTTCKVK